MSVDGDLRHELESLRGRLAQLEARLGEELERSAALPETFEVLLVRVGTTNAAFALETVREVVPMAELVPIPEAPPWVLGLLNVRGGSLPVVDVGARLEREAQPPGLTDLIVIVSTRLGIAGLVVDEVSTVQRLARAAIEASVHGTPHASYVLGTFTHAGQSTVLFGVPELLRHGDLAALLQAGEP
ncbi:MAG TPA: chemotaxis protein CheW [Polyangiaceae bacterium]|nr:chemotaxis protein CheW [Polyangiaceae bacterium]